MAKIKNVAETAKRKRIINAKECEYELRESLEKLFDAFWNAVRNYEKEVIQTPFTARCRGFEASLLNSKIIQSVQSVFKDDWTFGKYKRFMLRVKVGSINSIFYFLHKAAEPFNCLEQDNLA